MPAKAGGVEWKPSWGSGFGAEPAQRAFRALGGKKLVEHARGLGLSDDGIKRFVEKITDFQEGEGINYRRAKRHFVMEIRDIDDLLNRRPFGNVEADARKLEADARVQRREYLIYLHLLPGAFRR